MELGQVPEREPSSKDLSFDLLDPHFLQDPHPYYARLREHQPVYWQERSPTKGSWMVTRYEDVAAGFMDERLSSGSGRGSQTLKSLPEDMRAAFAPVIHSMELWALLLDKPKHTRVKNLLVTQGLKARFIEELRPKITQITHRLIDELQPKGEMEFNQDFAFRLHSMVLSEVLGIPQEDWQLVAKWASDISILVGMEDITPKNALRVHRSFKEIVTYFEKIISKYRGDLRQNFLTNLAKARDLGFELSDEELYAQGVVLIVGGLEPAKNLLINGLYLLFSHPEQFQKLKDQPDLINSAVEEFLRYESPIQMLGRIAHEDLEISGTRIKKGQHVLLFRPRPIGISAPSASPTASISNANKTSTSLSARALISVRAPLLPGPRRRLFSKSSWNAYPILKWLKRTPVGITPARFSAL